DRRIREWIVPATSVHFAHVHLTQFRTELSKNQVSLRHRRIILTGMADIEAERCIRKVLKDYGQFSCRATSRLALVHVLYTYCRSELTPKGQIRQRIRMNNDRPSAPDLS